MEVYDYWRSSAAYRVRIALNLKGLDYAQTSIDLRAGNQREKSYLELNPQGLVPFLRDGEVGLSQSLAIIEYLEERHPEPPLLPAEPVRRAQARAIALSIACDIHPLNNLRVLQYLERTLECDESVRMAWYRHWIAEGLSALEAMLPKTAGTFCVGDRPTIADVCLVPQVYNARRYHCDLEPFPAIRRIDEQCRALDAFARALPDRQPK
jgi:maleylpyruvate isomerase